MPAQTVARLVAQTRKNVEIERLYLQLAAFNERVQELEEEHPEASKIEALKVHALALAWRIDQICCQRVTV
jgi:hypothetical protein